MSDHKQMGHAKWLASASLSLLLVACGGGSDNNEAPISSSTPVTSQERVQAQALTTLGAMESGTGWLALSAAPSEPVGHGASPPPPGGQVYYVDSASSAPTSEGTLQAPWKTLADVQNNASKFKSGDAVLLKCGSVWREKLQLTSFTYSSNLLIGAYGADCTDARRPVIKGSVEVDKSGWQRWGKGFNYTYVKSVPTSNMAALPRLFLDGEPLTQARFPNKEDTNSEFATLIGVPINGTTPTKYSNISFIMGSKELNKLGLLKMPVEALRGTTVHIRTAPWMIETRQVKEIDLASGLVTLNAETKEPIVNGSGYILEGKPWLLGKPGQWAYDQGAGKLYWWPPLNKAPKDVPALLEAARLDTGLEINNSAGVRIERIRFEQQSVGVSLKTSSRITITDIMSRHADVAGVASLTGDVITVQDSKIIGAGEYGLNLVPTTNAIVRRNVITDTGMVARAHGSSAAIVARSFYKAEQLSIPSTSRVEENQILRSANAGIIFSNDVGTTVHQNTVIQPCMRLTDCGGIYTFTSDDAKTLQYIDDPARLPDGATVSSNVVVGARSNVDGNPTISGQSVKAGTNQAMGIYLDELTARTKVIGNTVANTEVGIYLHLARFNTIENNAVFNVSHASFMVGQDKNSRVPRQHVVRGNQVRNNRFFSHRPLDAGKLLSAPIYAFDAAPVYAQFWENTLDGDQTFFTDANGPANVSSGNTVFTTANVQAKTWRVDANSQLASRHGGVWGIRQNTASKTAPIDLDTWKRQASASADTETSPLAFKSYLLAQPEADSLIKNGNFDVDVSQWQPNPYPETSPRAQFTWVNSTPCSASHPCGRWQAYKGEHYLASNKFPVVANELYLLRYTLKAGADGALHHARIRKTGPTDYSSLGFNLLSWLTLAPGQEIQVEQFFRASASNAESVLSLTATDGSAPKDILVSKVSLIPITTMPTFRSQESVSVTVANTSDTPVSRDCKQWQLSTYNQCDLLDGDTGKPVTWPLIVPARSAKVLYFNDPLWLEN